MAFKVVGIAFASPLMSAWAIDTSVNRCHVYKNTSPNELSDWLKSKPKDEESKRNVVIVKSVKELRNLENGYIEIPPSKKGGIPAKYDISNVDVFIVHDDPANLKSVDNIEILDLEPTSSPEHGWIRRYIEPNDINKVIKDNNLKSVKFKIEPKFRSPTIFSELVDHLVRLIGPEHDAKLNIRSIAIKRLIGLLSDEVWNRTKRRLIGLGQINDGFLELEHFLEKAKAGHALRSSYKDFKRNRKKKAAAKRYKANLDDLKYVIRFVRNPVNKITDLGKEEDTMAKKSKDKKNKKAEKKEPKTKFNFQKWLGKTVGSSEGHALKRMIVGHLARVVANGAFNNATKKAIKSEELEKDHFVEYLAWMKSPAGVAYWHAMYESIKHGKPISMLASKYKLDEDFLRELLECSPAGANAKFAQKPKDKDLPADPKTSSKASESESSEDDEDGSEEEKPAKKGAKKPDWNKIKKLSAKNKGKKEESSEDEDDSEEEKPKKGKGSSSEASESESESESEDEDEDSSEDEKPKKGKKAKDSSEDEDDDEDDDDSEESEKPKKKSKKDSSEDDDDDESSEASESDDDEDDDD